MTLGSSVVIAFPRLESSEVWKREPFAGRVVIKKEMSSPSTSEPLRVIISSTSSSPLTVRFSAFGRSFTASTFNVIMASSLSELPSDILNPKLPWPLPLPFLSEM